MVKEEFKLLIGGDLLTGASHSEVFNPATGEPVSMCPRASAEQMNQAVASAKAAFPAWASTPLSQRATLLNALADRIYDHRNELGRLLTQEGGCPFIYTVMEVEVLVNALRYYSTQKLEPRTIEDSAERKATLYRRPLGVVAAITPWNYPLDVLALKLPPALLAGNTIIVKPAGTTPLTTLRLGELCRDILPPGVLNIVADDNDLGQMLSDHPDIRKISFTGSCATGSRVLASAAKTFKRVTLELGGNDAAVVLDDAEPAAIAEEIFFGAFAHNGQVCIGIKRLYVHETVYDEMCAELVKRCEAMVLGNGLEEGVTQGPLQNKLQFERAKTFLLDAHRDGKVLTGGSVIDGPGYFIQPTLVTDIREESRLVSEEQFCPVLPVIRFTDEDDMVRRVNNTAYGLGSSVWSKNNDRAAAVALQLDCGMVTVNKWVDVAPHLPFMGSKASGLGIEYGEEGLWEFTQLHLVNQPPSAALSE